MPVSFDMNSPQGQVDMFVTVKTDRGGVIHGESTDSEHPGKIEVQGWAWGMSSQTDASTGSASGRRMHRPLKLFKNIDGATCPLAIALAQNQVVRELILIARKAGGGDRGMTYLTIKLTQGRVIRQDLEYLDQSGGTSGREVVEIAYQGIEITYTPQSNVGLSSGAKTFTDSLASST